jgi:hypothetical protein
MTPARLAILNATRASRPPSALGPAEEPLIPPSPRAPNQSDIPRHITPTLLLTPGRGKALAVAKASSITVRHEPASDLSTMAASLAHSADKADADAPASQTPSRKLRRRLEQLEVSNAELRASQRQLLEENKGLLGEMASLREEIVRLKAAGGASAEEAGEREMEELGEAVEAAQASLSPVQISGPSPRKESFSVLSQSKAAKKRGPSKIPFVKPHA